VLLKVALTTNLWALRAARGVDAGVTTDHCLHPLWPAAFRHGRTMGCGSDGSSGKWPRQRGRSGRVFWTGWVTPLSDRS